MAVRGRGLAACQGHVREMAEIVGSGTDSGALLEAALRTAAGEMDPDEAEVLASCASAVLAAAWYGAELPAGLTTHAWPPPQPPPQRLRPLAEQALRRLGDVAGHGAWGDMAREIAAAGQDEVVSDLLRVVRSWGGHQSTGESP